jgi:RNA recognition motif-containing protein
VLLCVGGVQVKAIYVGNLPETVTEEKLRDVFKAYGEVRIHLHSNNSSSS